MSSSSVRNNMDSDAMCASLRGFLKSTMDFSIKWHLGASKTFWLRHWSGQNTLDTHTLLLPRSLHFSSLEVALMQNTIHWFTHWLIVNWLTVSVICFFVDLRCGREPDGTRWVHVGGAHDRDVVETSGRRWRSWSRVTNLHCTARPTQSPHAGTMITWPASFWVQEN